MLPGWRLVDPRRTHRGCGDYASLRNAHPDVPSNDLRGGFLLPGFIDTHIHFPQLRVIGGLGRSLLDWLENCALPEEARMADHAYACSRRQRVRSRSGFARNNHRIGLRRAFCSRHGCAV